VEDFRFQGKFDKRLTSILVIGLVGYAAFIIGFWLLA
jgi:hypothetical protein